LRGVPINRAAGEELLNLDSNLQARKELAQELHYSGDLNDSATMNVWLHNLTASQVSEIQ
jgi:hypothetical protein